ncbi:MAG: ROK family protein [Desulfitobacteriaceae bacterium]
MRQNGRKVTGTPNLLRRVNRNLILEILEEVGSLSRAQLAKRLDLSPPTVSVLVDELLADELVETVGTGESSGGRRPTLVRYKPEGHFMIGVDVRKDEVTAIWSDFSGHILERYQMRAEEPLIALETLLGRIISLHQAEAKRLAGIGIAVPGTVNVLTGEVLFAPEFNWRNLPLKQPLEERFRFPVQVGNDVNLAALGERWKGAAKGQDNVVLIAIGNGIGAGIVINGELFRGASFSAGEIGYMVVDTASLVRREPGFGPFEEAYSLSGLKRRVAEEYGSEDSLAGFLVDYGNREERARALMRDYCRYLAYGVGNVVSILNPEIVILAGELFDAVDGVLAEIAGYLQELTAAPVRLEVGRLGADATLLGAAHLVLQNMTNSVLFRTM